MFVLPSRLEGLGTSLLDASLCNLPLVATDTGGVPEIVRDGETGWLVPPRDSDALARGIVEAIENPEEARRRAGAAHWQTLEKFNLAHTGQKTLALWRRLLADRPL